MIAELISSSLILFWIAFLTVTLTLVAGLIWLAIRKKPYDGTRKKKIQTSKL